MLSIISHYGNAILKHEIPLYTKMTIIKKTLTRVGEDIEKSEHSYTAGGETK